MQTTLSIKEKSGGDVRGEQSSARRGSRVLSKPGQIGATDVRLVQPINNLRARQMPSLVEQCNTRNEAELLPALSSLTESSPRALRGESPVHVGAALILVQVFQLLL
jgi:hypothetical protein